MKNTIIGVVGPKLSGKGIFGKYVQEILAPRSVEPMSFSDVLYDTLTLWDVETSRHNLQCLAIVMNQEFGDGTLSRAVCKRLKNARADVVVLDGVRWLSDRAILHQKKNFILVAIVANIAYRYDRRKFGQKTGESSISREQFLCEEEVEAERCIEEISSGADYTISNNGTLKEFRDAVKTFCHTKLSHLLNM